MPTPSTVQWIDRVVFADRIPGGAEATLTLHYEECCEKSQTTFSILQVQSYKVEVSAATGKKQTYDFVDGVNVITLRLAALTEFNTWYYRNAYVPAL